MNMSDKRILDNVELNDAELDAVVGGSQSADPKTLNFYNSPSFRADYTLYPHTELA
jgi:hypothetical protein